MARIKTGYKSVLELLTKTFRRDTPSIYCTRINLSITLWIWYTFVMIPIVFREQKYDLKFIRVSTF